MCVCEREREKERERGREGGSSEIGLRLSHTFDLLPLARLRKDSLGHPMGSVVGLVDHLKYVGGPLVLILFSPTALEQLLRLNLLEVGEGQQA